MKKGKLLLAIVATSVMGLTSCGKKGGVPQTDAKTINIKYLLGGYGYEWLTELIKTFQTTYAKEGYKVNLLTPNKQVTGNNVKNDLLEGYSKKGVDIYFTGSLTPIRAAGEDGVLVHELDSIVYSQKALNFDGTEESKTVEEKLDSSFTPEWYKYNNVSYNFFYQRSIGGIMVNYDKLESCGFDYLPVTSNQFLNMIHTITENESRVRPFDYVANTGYASAALQNWFTQLAGINKWNTFLSMNKADGSYDLDNGKEVFNYPEWVDAGEKVFNMFDYNNFSRGAKNHSISQAHASIMTDYTDGGGVFLFDGDWALKETATVFKDENQLKKLRFINVPVNSSLGTSLWGEGTALDIKDTEKVDKILAKVITLGDENKSISEIKAAVLADPDLAVTLQDADIQRVLEARGIYYNRGLETGNAYIPIGVPNDHLDICSKFLRMIASDDFSKMYFRTSKCFSPYSSAVDETETLLPFSQGHKMIATNKYATGILPQTSGLRYAIGGQLNKFFPSQNTYYHNEALNSEITAYDEETGMFDSSKIYLYTAQAQAQSAASYQICDDNWEDWTAPFRN